MHPIKTILLIGFIFYGTPGLAVAPPKPKCSFAKLTDNCKAFDPAKEFFVTADGRKVPNFSFNDPVKWKGLEDKARDIRTKEYNEALFNRSFDLFAVLEKGASGRGAFALFANAHSISKIAKVTDGTFPKKDLDQKIDIPWPLDTEPSKFQTVKLSDLQTYLETHYSAADRKKIYSLTNPKESFSPPVHALYATLDRNQHIPQSELDQMLEFAKASVEKSIRQGRADSQLSVREYEAIVKVRAIEPNRKPEKFLVGCGGFMPNASYEPNGHTVTICRGFEYWPRETLMTVLGHEVAHAIDPCGCQHGLLDVNFEGIKKLAKDDKTSEKMKEAAQLLSSSDKKVVGRYTHWLYGSVPDEELKKLTEMGLVRELLPNHTYSDYPFRALVNCLEGEEGGGFRSSASGNVKMLEDLRQKSAVDEATLKRLEKNFKDHPECLPVEGKNSNMGEATADWFGGRAAADYLREKGKKLEGPDKLLPFLYFANLQCMILQPQPQADASGSVMGDIQNISATMGEHPMSGERIDRIVLRDPELAEQLGCQPTGARCPLTNSAVSQRPSSDQGVQ